ncbi:putative clathrin assembly protein [Camellia lanceoleosa]|uniref:Clathrin assembly protein n=1 Tax=Camellia lanceoleosa TaxID=1840588 RepID=A0ACC0HGX3_9ERIC|nr:putative clathrin assembly protein [Camellia lanceoleosa]
MSSSNDEELILLKQHLLLILILRPIACKIRGRGNIIDPSSSSFATSPQPKNDRMRLLPQHKVALEMDESIVESFELGDKNAHALAVVTSEYPSNSAIYSNRASQSTSWELRLHSTPSSNGATIKDSKLGGGLDKLILESLYNDALARTRTRTSTNHDENYHQQMTLQVESPLEFVPY